MLGFHSTYTYSPNGQRLTVEDANGNLAGMTYDGHDRQTEWIFPSKTVPGQLSAAECDQPGADCEEYGYDANGNRTSFTKRDGSTLTYQYDALNRMTVKIVPSRAGLGAIHTRDVYYGYDVGDRQTFARFDSATGEGVANAYDTLGRLQSSTLDMDGVARTLAYTLDDGGRRTQLAWPDARETSFSYDDAGRMQAIFQGGLGSTADLWTYSYSDHGRRIRKTARHGQYAEGLADGLGRLTSLHTELAGADNDNDTVFTYNPASQVESRAISNDAYAWTAHANVNRAYEVNGLNQYTEAGTATFGYDDNGNLISDPGSASGAAGVTTYLYDIENRLVRASSGAVSHTLLYDPLGRLYQIGGAGAGVVRFLYDGDELVAEYNGAGTLLRRYVHGAGIDDPLLWYEGADFGDQRWLIADHQGSIVAVTKGAPVLGLNSYDEYGIPASGNQGRFQFTGQAWIPELGMYHYKSRLYSPWLGRFMQTDPVGYEDQINLYAYVGNDPVNATDPTGMYICNSCSGYSSDGLLSDSRKEQIDFARLGRPRVANTTRGNNQQLIELRITKLQAELQRLSPGAASLMEPAGQRTETAVRSLEAQTSALRVTPLRNNTEARAVARALGFREVGRIRGTSVFSDGTRYISRDIPSRTTGTTHNGGVWKVGNSISDLGSKQTREGTWNRDLSGRIGD